MKKPEKHEPYCGCNDCKPVFELRHLLDMLERQEEARKQRLPKGPVAVPPDGGR